MGVLPLQFKPGESGKTLGLTGYESFEILGLDDNLTPGQVYSVRATADDGKVTEFEVISRIDTPVEANYYKNGGILQTVLRRIAQA
jgi:aconitate hydratase